TASGPGRQRTDGWLWPVAARFAPGAPAWSYRMGLSLCTGLYHSGRDLDHSAQYHGDTWFGTTTRLKCEDMSSPLDTVIASERQGRFAEALGTIQCLLTGDLPPSERAALALLGGRCALKQGGEQGYRLAQGYFDRARELYEHAAQSEMVAIVLAEEA